MKEWKKDKLVIKKYDTRSEMGAGAAKDAERVISNIISEKGEINIIFAALRRNKEEDKAFSQFAKNAIDVTSPEELLSFILTE